MVLVATFRFVLALDQNSDCSNRTCRLKMLYSVRVLQGAAAGDSQTADDGQMGGTAGLQSRHGEHCTRSFACI